MSELRERQDDGLGGLVESAREYAKAARSEETKRAYRSDWQSFASWCEDRGVQPMPAVSRTVAAYLAHLANSGRRVSTISRALVSISEAHKARGEQSPAGSPVVKAVLRGLRRKLGVAPQQKAPILADQLKAMARALPTDLQGLRDRAMLLVGFAGAFRRSELVALNTGDVVFSEEGLEITLRRSKTDQDGASHKIGVPYGSTAKACPVRSLRAWLDAASITNGAVFRSVSPDNVVGSRASDRAVARAVKRAAEHAGLDASLFAGHSLRAGLATTAAKAGKSERAIMKQTRHRSTTMVRRYIRDADLFDDNAAAGLL
jgi:site-specific recombinase XerD